MPFSHALEDIINKIQIDSTKFCISHFEFPPLETPATTLAQLQTMSQNIQHKFLKSKLLGFIHSIYFEGLPFVEVDRQFMTNEQILQDMSASEIDWEFYEQLERNNKGKGWFHPRFHIIGQETDGSLAVIFDKLILNIQPERHLPPSQQSATTNDEIEVLLPSSYINGYFYRANGDVIGALPPEETSCYSAFAYLNFRPEAVVSAMRYITTKLNAMKVPFLFEVLHNPLKYKGYKSGILKFLSYHYQEFILPVLQTIYTENQSHFQGRVPLFTKMLAPGIALAEQPYLELESELQDFGMNRCEIVTNALLEAHQNGDESPKARMKYIQQHFERSGISLERPYLKPSSEDIYTLLDWN